MSNFNKRCQMFASLIYRALSGSNWGGTIRLELLSTVLTHWRFLSTNLCRVSLHMGGQFSLKLGVCDRIVYHVFFFHLVCFDSSLSLWHRPAKRLKAPAAAFVVDARAPRFSVSSLLCCSLHCPSHMCWVSSTFIEFNPSFGWTYIQ